MFRKWFLIDSIPQGRRAGVLSWRFFSPGEPHNEMLQFQSCSHSKRMNYTSFPCHAKLNDDKIAYCLKAKTLCKELARSCIVTCEMYESYTSGVHGLDRHRNLSG